MSDHTSNTPSTNIYAYVTDEEAGFKKPISLEFGWWWNFRKHVRRSYLYKHSQFSDNNEDRDKRPFKNIVRPILNIAYRTEGFDVKDIELFVNNAENYFKSFLVQKFHVKWALKHEMDTFIDELVESFVDYGGVLVKNVEGIRPEVVDLRTIAFADQTNFLGGPFAIKHFFSPDELREMGKNGWGDTSKGATISLEDLIAKSEKSKQQYDTVQNATPGKNIEVFEVHGTFPESYLKGESDKYTSQIHIVAFYKDDQGKDQGVTLFASKEPKLPFKFLKRDPVQARALGFGAVEELFEAQVWTNFSAIEIREILELASKTFFKTDDPRFKTRNNLINADNGQIFDLQKGSDLQQIDTQPKNLAVFNDSLDRWERHANTIGSASEALQGDAPTSGTPFKLFEAQLIENKGLHIWRQGRIAVFVDEIYREWVIPYIKREIVKGQKFLSELSADELQKVATDTAKKKVSDFVKERILNGQPITNAEKDEATLKIQTSLLEGGNKKFLEILKDELKDDELDVLTNIKGKQKNLALLTDKLVNVLRQFISTPEIRQDPEMVKLLNVILESSGMSPIMFGPQLSPIQPQGQGGTEPLKELAKVQNA